MSNSEATSKKKRGRPPAFSAGLTSLNASLRPELGKRQLQNFIYCTYAMRIIMGEAKLPPPEYHWLFDGVSVLKVSILAELGRLAMEGAADDEQVRELAVQLCQQKPKVKDAVAWLRRMRTGKATEASSLTLLITLARTLDAYVQSHPETTNQQVRTALQSLLDDFAE